jgi:gas vesicle protein
MDSERERQAVSFLSGLVLGAVIGAGVAMLTTPQQGKKSRRQLRKAVRRVRGSASDRLDDLASELKGRIDDAVGSARERLPG